MWFGLITLLPEMFTALNYGVTGRAIQQQLINIDCWNPRDFTHNKHRSVDDRPYGGGPGMVMMAQPLQDAIHAAKKAAANPPLVVYLSPQGKLFNQKLAEEKVQQKNIILIAGRYEGVDQRLIDEEVDEEWSVGDYVLSGGELAAMIVIDTLARLVPGVLGHNESAAKDSLSSGLLEHPQYTRPPLHNGLAVPEVLMGGNHRDISRWQLKESLGNTWLKRPELLATMDLKKDQWDLLKEFIEELTINKPTL